MTPQAEDDVAETFAMIGQFAHAKKHCQASMEVCISMMFGAFIWTVHLYYMSNDCVLH